MKRFSKDDRKLILNSLISLFDQANIENVNSFSSNFIDSILKIKGIYDNNPEEYELLKVSLLEFINIYKNELFSIFPQK